MKKERLKFRKGDDEAFFLHLKAEVYGYFEKNKQSRFANTGMLLKTLFFIGIFVCSYCLVLFSDMSNSWKLLLCAVHGLSIAGIGFNVAHDSSHDAYFRSKKLNRLLSFSMDLMGSNSYMWDIKHNKAHHIYTNIDEFDEDIRGSFLLRLSPHAPFNPVNRYQFLYAWPLYCFIYFYIVWFYNFVQFRAERFGPFSQMRHPLKEWIRLFAWKAFYVFYAVVFPVLWMDNSVGTFLIGYAVSCAAAGFLLGLIFYLAHCVDHCFDFPLPQDAIVERSWVRNQLETTSNFAMNNSLVTWFCGGLNYQVEHHLFPDICSVHYSRISPIVQRVAAEYGMPYKTFDSFGDALKSHYQALKKLSKA
jgi:linoleoyl-CoA desaturase